MKIAINALFLRQNRAGGTETYITNIVSRWYQNPEHGCEMVLYANHEPAWWSGDRPWFRLIKVDCALSTAKRIIYEQVVLARASGQWDCLFCPGYVGLLGAACPQVITVHDAYAWVMPREAGRLHTAYWRFMIGRSAPKAAAVIADSENTKKDLLKYTRVVGDRVHVIHLAGDHVPVMAAVDVAKQEKQPNYFLCIGFFKPVKNPQRILTAFSHYRQKALDAGIIPCVLKLAGAVNGKAAEAIANEARKMEGVEIIGRIGDDELITCLAGAFGLIFPSLYEGFGIPILEAQILGCPVLTSSISSMGEVAGDGAILVDPLDVSAIRDGMLALHRTDLRRDLIDKGRANERKFSWEKASNATLSLLKSVATRREMKSVVLVTV